MGVGSVDQGDLLIAVRLEPRHLPQGLLEATPDFRFAKGAAQDLPLGCTANAAGGQGAQRAREHVGPGLGPLGPLQRQGLNYIRSLTKFVDGR